MALSEAPGHVDVASPAALLAAAVARQEHLRAQSQRLRAVGLDREPGGR